MTRGSPGGTARDVHYGPPADDPLAARLFPRLPGEVRWGLERIRRILARMGDPLADTPVLHVGGTNGKGTVARIWEAVLQEAGLRVGLYTSPNLVSFRERILVDGLPLPDSALAAWADELAPFLLRDRATFFEAATALALVAFERSEVDVAVLEVGLGGRLDATNVVVPAVSAITNISLEHTAMLGADLPSIAMEKAGIMKPGVPTFTAVDDPEALAVLAEVAATHGVPLHRVGAPPGESSLAGSRLTVTTRRWGRLELASPLVGRHQRTNVALAVRALEGLPPRVPVTAEAVRGGVARARLPGRFQVEVEGGRTWVLDVAHNPAAAAALATTFLEVVPPGRRVGVVGILKDKDVEGILKHLAAVLDGIVLTTPTSVHPSRKWDASSARELIADDTPTHLARDVDGALERARSLAGDRGTVLVTGSFPIVGEALQVLGRVPVEALPPSSDFG